jgi:hypothetical protein
MQIAYLKSLGDNNAPPATMADASLRIDALKVRWQATVSEQGVLP